MGILQDFAQTYRGCKINPPDNIYGHSESQMESLVIYTHAQITQSWASLSFIS